MHSFAYRDKKERVGRSAAATSRANLQKIEAAAGASPGGLEAALAASGALASLLRNVALLEAGRQLHHLLRTNGAGASAARADFGAPGLPELEAALEGAGLRAAPDEAKMGLLCIAYARAAHAAPGLLMADTEPKRVVKFLGCWEELAKAHADLQQELPAHVTPVLHRLLCDPATAGLVSWGGAVRLALRLKGRWEAVCGGIAASEEQRAAAQAARETAQACHAAALEAKKQAEAVLAEAAGELKAARARELVCSLQLAPWMAGLRGETKGPAGGEAECAGLSRTCGKGPRLPCAGGAESELGKRQRDGAPPQ
jgi:hypothetical protein